jgi:hypothetical protein
MEMIPALSASRLNPFNDDCRGHAATGAHGDQPALQIATLEFVKYGTD